MRSISNKKVAFLICFVANVIHFIECSTESDLIVNDGLESLTTQSAAVKNSDLVMNASFDSDAEQSVEPQPTIVRSKQLRNLVMGSYHNYRSSYVGDKSNRRLVGSRRSAQTANRIESAEQLNKLAWENDEKTAQLPLVGDEIKYNVGPGVNISVDVDKELVSVYLDEDCLKDVFTGRGRKQDLITKILPLFILPFLIQSAIIPFLVSTLKLLLIKSIVVGKIAIFLLLLSAFRNHVKYAYDASPSYYPDAPNRRSEAQLTGYRIEGKPAAWITN